jgi:hypothetical protein
MERLVRESSHKIIFSVLLTLVLTGYANCQTENQKPDLKQYLFPAFTRSQVKMKTGKVVNLTLNYNTVSEKMVFDQNGQYLDIANPETSDTVFIEGRKFIPYKDIFLEVIVADKISLFVQNRSDLLPPPRPAGYGTTSDLTASNYYSGMVTPSGYYNFTLPEGYTVKLSPVYWIKANNEYQSFITEKQFLKIFPDKSDLIRKYTKDNRLKYDRQADLTKIVDYCNELIK